MTCETLVNLDDFAPARQSGSKSSTSKQLFHNQLIATTSPFEMLNSVPLQIAETIQTASINKAPSPAHDLNPSTAASEKQPVSLEHATTAPASDSSADKYVYDDEEAIDDDEDIPYNVLKPTPRRQSLGPMPDLRFEQSYLASIAKADTKWKVAMITIRDQVCQHDLVQTLGDANIFPRSLCR